MKKKEALSQQEKQLFKDAVGQVKPMVQDKIHPQKTVGKSKCIEKQKNPAIQQAQFHFSDDYQPYLGEQGPMKYVRDDVSSYESKNLRRGDYVPDLILDLHGLNQQQAQREIAALLHACQKEHAHCVCIVHGIGSKVLKNKVPHWLVQHPDVMAFHQAPLQWGGAGALLVLVELKDKQLSKDR